MNDDTYPHSHLSKYLVRSQALIALVLLLGLCSFDFFFPSAYSLQAGIHGVTAISAVVFGTLLTHRIYPLIRGIKINFDSLRLWAVTATLLNLLGAISGNWIYMRYRGQGGPRDWILENVPFFHKVLMEFKEFVTLFPFPIMLTTTFILYYYKADIQFRRDLALFVGISIFISWFFLVFGFVAGLVLAKLRFV
jgi:hypothetical protein